MAFTKRLDVELLEIFKIHLNKDSAVDVIGFETFNERHLEAHTVHPVDDV